MRFVRIKVYCTGPRTNAPGNLLVTVLAPDVRGRTGVFETKALSREHLPCNLAAMTALHPLIWCSEKLIAPPVSFS